MWSSKDWIVRNNYIDGIPGGSGIRSYGVINALIEHNTISNVKEGIMWKDHFVEDLTSRQHVFESEIRYNLVSANDYGVLIQIRGSSTPEAGHNYIHHNIFYGLNGSEKAGLRQAMAGAYAQSGETKFSNNLVDCSKGSQTAGVTIDASSKVEFFGNIFLKCGTPFEAIKYSDINVAQIVASNYNLFIDTFGANMDRYSTTAKTYSTLTDWQSAKDISTMSLVLDNPDTNSKMSTSTAATFITDNGRLYVPQSTSPAIGMLPDGTNAGPYQLGTEIIGVIKQSPPLPPK